MTGILVRGGLCVIAALVGFAVLMAAALAHPQPFFRYHAALGRLSLYSDRPFDPARGRAALADVEARLETSPLDDHKPHAIVIANAPWRQAVFMNAARGAAGVNFYPITNDVFLRHSDIGRDIVFGASGRPAAPPRTLAYYGAHEIAHSFTAERLGAGKLWNRELPQWVREGYADYVGMGGRVDIDDLYRWQSTPVLPQRFNAAAMGSKPSSDDPAEPLGEMARARGSGLVRNLR